MTDSVIRVESLSKLYRIGERGGGMYRTLRDVLSDAMYAPFRAIASAVRGQRSAVGNPSPAGGGRRSADDNFIWALKDVSFEVKQGEVVGIIGRNGAGKTTLLKILCRITEPTEGYAEVHGRVGSLLEVGTGFHPELTGRENIYLNGAILGMKKAEIERKFDEIVAFAEVERFIDTPVKYYSSGMYVRLAFAVAAHLEPEVLLVDEVLAVGDIAFQKKCLGKMGDMPKEGRTVLFVSHNMGAINYLCERAVLLNNGIVVMDDAATRVTREYSMTGMDYSAGQRVWLDIAKAPGDDFVRVHSIRSLDQEGKVCAIFDVRDPVILEIEYQVLKEIALCTHFELFNELGLLILTTKDNLDSAWRDTVSPRGAYRAKCYIPGDFFNDGHIAVSYGIITGHHGVRAREFNALVITIEDRLDPRGVRGNVQYGWSRAAVRPRFRWTVEQKSLEEKLSFPCSSSD